MTLPLRHSANPFPSLFSQTKKADKDTSEDETTNAQTSTPTPDTNTPQQPPSPAPTDSNQSNEVAEPAPSSSPTVSQQHQSVYQLPFLPVMYTQLPNMTSHPRMPQGMSVESDGSDLPDGTFIFTCLTS